MDLNLTLEYLQGFSNIENYLQQMLQQSTQFTPLININNLYEINQNQNQTFNFGQVIEEVEEEYEEIEKQHNFKQYEQEQIQVEVDEEEKKENFNNNQSKDYNLEFEQQIAENLVSETQNNQKTEEIKINLDFNDLDLFKNDSYMRILYSFTFRPPNKDQQQYLQEQLQFIQSNQHWSVCIYNIFQTKPRKCKQAKLIYSDEQTGHYIFKKGEWRKDSTNGRLYYINQEVIDAQKQVLKFLISSINKNIFSGTSILNISLPVLVFEHRSNLERFAFALGFAPVYLEKAGITQDPVEQMKQSVAFFLTTILMYFIFSKPYNPILGETFQGFIHGMPVYCEQISHHPPICAYQIYGNTFMLEGKYESKANLHFNSVSSKNQGLQTIHFYQTKNKIQYIGPGSEINNITLGDRYINFQGQCFTYDLDNKLIAIINFNPEKKKIFSKAKFPVDYINGGIYKMKQSLVNRIKSMGNQSDRQLKEINTEQELDFKVSDIQGFWDEEISFDGVKYYTRENPLPYKLEYEKHPLASDSNFRQDLIAWRTKDRQIAQNWKEQLENIQRKDRELRKKLAINPKH